MKRLTVRLSKLIQLLVVPFLLFSSGLLAYEIFEVETEDILENDFLSILSAIDWPEFNTGVEISAFNETFGSSFSIDLPYNILSLQLTDDFTETVNHLALVVYLTSEASAATLNVLPDNCRSKSRVIVCSVNEEKIELLLSERAVWEGGFVWLDSNIIVPAFMADRFAHKLKSPKGALLSYSPLPTFKRHPYFDVSGTRPVLVNMFKTLSGASGNDGNNDPWKWRQASEEYPVDEPITEFGDALRRKLLEAFQRGQLANRKKIQLYAGQNNIDEKALIRWVNEQNSSISARRTREYACMKQVSLDKVRGSNAPYIYHRSNSMPAAGKPQTPQGIEPQRFFSPVSDIPILRINRDSESSPGATASQQPTASEKIEEEPVEIDTSDWSSTYDSDDELECGDDDQGDVEEDDEEL